MTHARLLSEFFRALFTCDYRVSPFSSLFTGARGASPSGGNLIGFADEIEKWRSLKQPSGEKSLRLPTMTMTLASCSERALFPPRRRLATRFSSRWKSILSRFVGCCWLVRSRQIIWRQIWMEQRLGNILDGRAVVKRYWMTSIRVQLVAYRCGSLHDGP